MSERARKRERENLQITTSKTRHSKHTERMRLIVIELLPENFL